MWIITENECYNTDNILTIEWDIEAGNSAITFNFVNGTSARHEVDDDICCDVANNLRNALIKKADVWDMEAECCRLSMLREDYDIMMMGIEELDLPVRIFNTLKNGHIDTVADIIALSKEELMRIRYMETRYLTYIKNSLCEHLPDRAKGWWNSNRE